MDPFSSSGSVLRNDELVSNIAQTLPVVDPTMLTGPSGSNNEIEEPQIRQTNPQLVPHPQFEIEREAFIVTPQHVEDPRNIKAAHNYPAKEKGKKRLSQ